MNLQERINTFSSLGKWIHSMTELDKNELFGKAYFKNNWFTPINIQLALNGLEKMLNEESLKKWVSEYNLNPKKEKKVGIIMAGNIPFVGFHDLLSVLISGHKALIKASSQDLILIQEVVNWLEQINPEISHNISLVDKLKEIDAVIATGSDNSSRYFEYYFSRYPHIIRKNRTSIAILSGNENSSQIKDLGSDIFQYFGLGCRNVSKLFIPENYDLTQVFPHWENFRYLIDHHKYANNYDYNKAVYLVNQTEHLDAGHFLSLKTPDLVSPISVIYYEEYNDIKHLQSIMATIQNKIQCQVGMLEGITTVPFGQAQYPELWDYSDNINTLEFLSKL